MTFCRHLLPGLAAGSLLIADAVHAQTEHEIVEGPRQIENIVVTAQRRSENLQDIPITIQAITSESAEQRGVESLSDLAAIVGY